MQSVDRNTAYHMIAHSDEEIEEHSSPQLHLSLHRSTSFEGLTTANDESKVMSTKFGISIWCMAIGIPGRSEDSTNLDARLQALLSQSKTLELLKPISVSCTATWLLVSSKRGVELYVLDDGVLE